MDKGPGYFELPDDGKTYYIFQRREYARAKKPKVVYALFQFFGSRKILINPEAELQKYSRVFAQDTNYKKVAVTTLCEARRSALSGVYSAHIVDTWTFLPETTSSLQD